MVGGTQQEGGQGMEWKLKAPIWSTNRRQRELIGNGIGFQDLHILPYDTPPPRVTHSSKSVTPPNPFQQFHCLGMKESNVWVYGGPSTSNHHSTSMVQVWQPAVSKHPKALDRETSHHWLTSPAPIQRGIVGFLASTLRENKERGGRTSDAWSRPSGIRQQRRRGCQCTQSSFCCVSSPHCCWVFTYTYKIEVVWQDANWNLLYFYPHSLVPPRPGREVIHIHAWRQRGRELILYFWLKAEGQGAGPTPMHENRGAKDSSSTHACRMSPLEKEERC